MVIQLGLAALGAAFAVQAAMGALEHGKQWLTLAWTANGDPAKLAQASRAFLGMLVEIAMAALAMLGARANAGKGLRVYESVKITPPKLGWSPGMVTPDGAVLAGGPVFTPGSVTSAGASAIDIGASATSGLGPAGTFAAMSASGDGAKAGTAQTSEANAAPSKSGAEPHATSAKPIVNSGGTTVLRRIVSNQEQLLQAAQKAAGGSLDKLTEFKPGWWQGTRPDGTRVKIEWETVGHATTNEGPHVIVRVWDASKGKKGRWQVVEKYFIDGQETLR